MYKIKVKRFFEAAHQLTDSNNLVTKQCANLHGHTYHVIVEIIAKKNDNNGMVIDFKAIKNIIDKFDHTTILKQDNPLVSFINKHNLDKKVITILFEPTAENIAKIICDEILTKYRFTKITVKVGEGYKGPDHTSYVEYKN